MLLSWSSQPLIRPIVPAATRAYITLLNSYGLRPGLGLGSGFPRQRRADFVSLSGSYSARPFSSLPNAIMAFRSRQQQELARKPLAANTSRLNVDGPFPNYGGSRGNIAAAAAAAVASTTAVPSKSRNDPPASISRLKSGSAPLFAMHQENFFDDSDGLDDQDFLDLDLDDLMKPVAKPPPKDTKVTSLSPPGNNPSHGAPSSAQTAEAATVTTTSSKSSLPPPAWGRPPSPPRPSAHNLPPSQVPSSAPIPWSSSPPRPAHTTINSFSRPSVAAYSSSSSSPALATIQKPVPEPKARTVTRKRTLPWKIEDPAPVDSIPSERSSSTRHSIHEEQPQELPKKKSRSAKKDYPWEKAPGPSQLDEKEFKEIRKQQKKAGGRAITEARKTDKASDNSAPKAIPGIFLSEEQQRILDIIVKHGKSVFFTGSAGTGKSVLMREAIRQLKNKYRHETDRVAVTASTGLAACNIGGMTLHSFAGAGLAKEPIKQLVKKIRGNPKAKNRWQRVKVLIIDEVSMVDGELFDKLEQVARELRNNGRPFGGIQLVVTGDFFQLPPVPDNMQGVARAVKFAFDANTWNTCIEHTILLTQVFRQKDPEFAAMLNCLRLGQMTPEINRAFSALARELPKDAIEATELFAKRSEVDNANGARLHRLTGDVHNFKAVDSGKDPVRVSQLLSNCMAPPEIRLKRGAQVMLIKNLDDTLVNGSLGRVVDFMDSASFEAWKLGEGKYDRGMTLQEVKNEKKLMAAMSLPGYKPTDEMLSGKANSPHAPPGRKWPLVCFVQPDGTERHLLCQPEDWKVELPNGEIEAQRLQIPLILAWALSIHKAQGQTLQRVKVDLGKVFEKGQAYVALSRAVSKEGLQVKGWNPSRVMVHDDVIEFYKKLSTATDLQISNRRKVRMDQYMATAPAPIPAPIPAAAAAPPAPHVAAPAVSRAPLPAPPSRATAPSSYTPTPTPKPVVPSEKRASNTAANPVIIDPPMPLTTNISKAPLTSQSAGQTSTARSSRPPPVVIDLIDDDEEALAAYMP